MSRYIDADDLIAIEWSASEALIADGLIDSFERGMDKVIRYVKSMPTADVEEVVRCRGCRYWIDHRCRDKHANMDDWRSESDFCSFGKRKDGEQDEHHQNRNHADSEHA